MPRREEASENEAAAVSLHRNDWDTLLNAISEHMGLHKRGQLVGGIKFRDADSVKFLDALYAGVLKRMDNCRGDYVAVGGQRSHWIRAVDFLAAYECFGAASRLTERISEAEFRQPKPDNPARRELFAAEVQRLREEGEL